MTELILAMTDAQPAEAQTPPPAQAPAAPEAPATVGAPAEGGLGGPRAEVPAPGVVIINGREFPLGGAEGGGHSVTAGAGFPFPPDIPPNVMSLAMAGILGVTLMIIAFPVFGLLRALVNRRANAQAALPPREVTERLQRIESAVDAMAVEVERISEGQRFVTKALSERSATPR